MQRPILGVLGGVGPLATAAFMQTVIEKTPATCDQDNLAMIVFNDPQIPDRTAYILDQSSADPKPEMIKVARWLQDAGADFIAIPCNTAHYYFDAIESSVDVPVLNIMELTASAVAARFGQGATVGLLATQGTVQSGVFQGYFEEHGLVCQVPDEALQAEVTALIYQKVKANQPWSSADLLALADAMLAQGCDCVVLGCTELSVIYRALSEVPVYLIDAMDVLAAECVSFAELLRRALGAQER